MIVSPGASSVPANIDPHITQLPPAASAFTTSPEYRRPPSAIIGTPVPSSASATSKIALNCGTPTPAMIRVVQILPGPIPTFTPSAPFSTKNRAASAVAIFPTTTSKSGYLALIDRRALTMFLLCPCAESSTTASTCSRTSASTRSM